MTTVWCGFKYAQPHRQPGVESMFYGAHHIGQERVHPVKGRDASPCVNVGPGLWREKLYHFRPDAPPSSDGDEVQSEFYVPYKDFRKVLESLYEIRHVFKHLV